jgi:hypothetical protein
MQHAGLSVNGLKVSVTSIMLVLMSAVYMIEIPAGQ